MKIGRHADKTKNKGKVKTRDKVATCSRGYKLDVELRA